MAGHNFSRYLPDFWSAPFAPFHFLFSRIWRIWHFVAQAFEPGNIASPPSPRPPTPSTPSPLSLPTPPSSAPGSAPGPTPCSPSISATSIPRPPPATTAAGATNPNLPSAPSVLPPSSRDQGLSHLLAGEHLPDLAITGSSLDGQNNDAGLGHAADSWPQDSHRHQSLDMTRRRAGRGRGGGRDGGAKSAITHQPTTVTPAVPVSLTADAVQGWPASGSQSNTNALGDTSFTHSNGPKFTSLKRGDDHDRNRNSPAIQKQLVGSQKENVVPLKNNDAKLSAAPLDSPALPPFAMTDNAGESQKPGACSRPAANSLSAASTISSTCDGSSTSCSGVEQLHAIADRLTLDDTPPSQQPAHQTLDEAAAASKASALPVPLIVAVPVLQGPRTVQLESESTIPPSLPGLIEPTTDEERAEREYHLGFMREALEMGDLALKTNETPVGCVLVYRGIVIARGMNATNITRNGTRHAEFMALSALLSRKESSDINMADINPHLDGNWGDVDPRDGHIYPYGQKLHPAPIVDRSIVSECILYVTVEPCVMCASLLRQLGIKKVYFGAVNDKFGGTGGVFRVHMNSKPVVIPKGRPYQQGYGPQDVNLISKGRAVVIPREDDEGDGGNVEPGYPVEGGYLRDDAVSLLRRFYVQENGRAPQPRKKEGRAARLYAAMENQNKAINTSDLSDNTPETPVDCEAPTILGGKPDSDISVIYA
ncbi:putative tRNA-specific adenosine deaminase-like protein [Rosellinia necatrix]|uniref:Putative tRNA-specific adenosine deaminase-like protein n=1 Tax=Rosellinia necatrix TaxID=77044 RepID=A0A1W2TNH9_ROSNE|nr:putative tRNA-specific adenosine deaminase-like protein [Rosellinia necatrix]